MFPSVQASLIILLLCSLANLQLSAQQVMKIEIDRLPATHANDPVYLTGNFNGWNPAEEEMRLLPGADGRLELSVTLNDVPSDRLEYKFTRGNWQSSECTAEGRLIGPRVAKLGEDIHEIIKIDGWRDDFPAHTISPNVQVLDSVFYIPQLNKHRKIWIYLPADYTTNTKRYPVIYMHDGQHLFDEATSQGRIGPIEWGVDETLDDAEEACIIVAINHQDDYADREAEFFVYPNNSRSEVQGSAYLTFIVETLKPYVDHHYRSLPDKKNTAIVGSSLGGLVSFYAGLYYPETFGILGIFSPSIWMDESNLENELRNLTTMDDKVRQIATQKYYFYAGLQENRRKEDGTFVRMEEDVKDAINLLQTVSSPQVTLALNPYGRHGALHWKEAFPLFYQWFESLNSRKE